MGNLQDIDRNNSEWHQVLDRDNDEPSWKNFPLSFYPLGTPGPINCIPSMPMPHEFVMLLADEFTHLLVQKTNSHGDAKHLSKSGDENVNLGRKMEAQNQGRVPCLLGNCANMGLIRKGSMFEYWTKTD